jgi:endonuclease I
MLSFIIMLSFRSVLVKCLEYPQIYNFNLNKIYNNQQTLEHIFPKCYMNKNTYNDMHNIFSCNKDINNIRSNYKFIDSKNKEYYDNINHFYNIKHTDNYCSPKLKLFIPENDSKGIISRCIMYMSYEYKYNYEKIIDYDNLIEWSIKYPPTKQEYLHNTFVFKKQYKKNQFIDLYYKKNYIKYISNLFYNKRN